MNSKRRQGRRSPYRSASTKVRVNAKRMLGKEAGKTALCPSYRFERRLFPMYDLFDVCIQIANRKNETMKELIMNFISRTRRQRLITPSFNKPVRISTIPLVLVLLAATGACRHGGKGGASGEASQQPGHETAGVIQAVDANQGTIQIAHDEIKGFMPAMTMSFHVKKKKMLEDVKAGDKVQFTIKEGGPDGYTIGHLKKAQ